MEGKSLSTTGNNFFSKKNGFPLISVTVSVVEKRLSKRKWFPQDKKPVCTIGNKRIFRGISRK